MLKIWFMDIFLEKLLEEEFENLLEAKKNHKNDKKKSFLINHRIKLHDINNIKIIDEYLINL